MRDPNAIDDVMNTSPTRLRPDQPALCVHPCAGAAAHLDLQLWLDALHVLTFQEGNLIEITTGDYGHYIPAKTPGVALIAGVCYPSHQCRAALRGHVT